MTNTIEFYRGSIRGLHRWRIRASNGEIVAASTESYTEKRGAVENVAFLFGAGIHAGHHLIPNLEDRQAVEAAIRSRYDVIDIDAVADHVGGEES